MGKGARGGKYSESKINADKYTDRQQSRRSDNNGSVTYIFYNARLRQRPITGINREDVIRKAEQLGYSAGDLRRRRR